VKIMPDFGAVHENEAAFDVAVASITSGDIECGRSILAALRDHICSTGEQTSVQWILRAPDLPTHSYITSQVGEQGLRKVLRRKNTSKNDHSSTLHGMWGSLVSYPLAAVPI
jgi:hypothetical protein